MNGKFNTTYLRLEENNSKRDILQSIILFKMIGNIFVSIDPEKKINKKIGVGRK